MDSNSSENKTTSILIVDDEELLLKMLKQWFIEEGFDTEGAPDAETALELAKKKPFDFMLSDIVLPRMQGLELTEKISELRPETDIIIMTGFGDEFSFDQAMDAGATDFIKKPFTFQEVMSRMKIVKMRKDLHAWAITDELTGIHNRKGFFTLAEHLLKISKRTRSRIFILYADLDNLKEINDTFGHKEGDAALITVAGLLKANFRESDVVARIGGDEFVVLPVGTTDDCISIITERLHNLLDDHNRKKTTAYPLSLSYGISSFDPDSPSTLSDLLEKADEAMYDMKKQRKVP